MIYSGDGEAARLIADEGCSVVVPPESPAKLADAIAALAAHPVHRDELGARGRAFVEREYSWRAIVARWLAEIGYRTDSPVAQPGVGWLQLEKSGRQYT